MTKGLRVFSLFFGISLLAVYPLGKGQAQAAKGADNERVAAQAREVLQPVKETFLKTLKAMLAKGPENALAACMVVAPTLVQTASTNGVRIGRTSHRLRNPNNAPKEWMRPYLQEFQNLSPDPKAFRVADLPKGKKGYVEPIYVKSMCLQCHGQYLSKPVQDKLKLFYPQDQATGFKEGDFRGLFWVEMEPAQ